MAIKREGNWAFDKDNLQRKLTKTQSCANKQNWYLPTSKIVHLVFPCVWRMWCWVHLFQIQLLLSVLKVLGGLWEWAIFPRKFSLLAARNVIRSELSESAGNWAQSSKLRTTKLVSVGTTKAVSNWGTPVFNALFKYIIKLLILTTLYSTLSSWTLLHVKT